MAITDKFTKGTVSSRPVPTELTSSMTTGDTTITCDALTGWPTTAVHFIIYNTDANNRKVSGSQTDYKGTVSGSTITNIQVKAGSDPGYGIGAIVEASPTAAWVNDMVDGILVHADQDGTLAAGAVDNAAVLASDVVTTAKILNSNVTTAKIADGNVTSEKLSATIACKAYRSAAFNVTGGSSTEKLILDAEVYDTGGDWDTTNGRFTAPVTGYYQVNMQLNLSNVDSTGIVVTSIFVNGVPYAYFSSFSSASTQEVTANGSDLVYVTAGQYIEMYVDCSTTEAVEVGSTSTFMSIYFVGT